jgi:hypothetical protein
MADEAFAGHTFLLVLVQNTFCKHCVVSVAKYNVADDTVFMCLATRIPL